MTETVSTVECVLCYKTHLETPPEREVVNKDGVKVWGLDAHDWTYYRDWYKGVYAVICKKSHDKMLAPELARVES